MFTIILIILFINIVRMIAENTGETITTEREKPPAILRDQPPIWWDR